MSLSSRIAELRKRVAAGDTSRQGELDRLIKQRESQPRSGGKKRSGGVSSEINRARGDAERSGLLQNLDTLDNTVPMDQQNLINQLQSQTDPTSSMFAGRRTAEQSDILAKLSQGLQGLSAAENQGLRDAMNEEINRSFATAQRGRAIEQSRSGVRGAAAMAGEAVATDQFQKQRNATERDLMLKNIEIQDSRRGAYQQALSGQENQEFNRLSTVQNTLGNNLVARNAQVTDINKTNLEQANKKNAGDVATILGIAGLNSTNRLTNRQLDILGRQSRNSGGGNQAATDDATAAIQDYRRRRGYA